MVSEQSAMWWWWVAHRIIESPQVPLHCGKRPTTSIPRLAAELVSRMIIVNQAAHMPLNLTSFFRLKSGPKCPGHSAHHIRALCPSNRLKLTPTLSLSPSPTWTAQLRPALLLPPLLYHINWHQALSTTLEFVISIFKMNYSKSP